MSSKDKIIKSAIELFATNGFSSTSIQKIADESGISQTTVLYHYKNKKLLFEACLECGISNNRDLFYRSLEKTDSDYEKLRKFLRMNLYWASHYPKECQLFLLLYYFASNDKNFEDLVIRLKANGFNLLKSFIEPLTSDDVQANLVAEILQKYVHGVMFNIVATHQMSSLEIGHYEKQMDQILEKFLNKKGS